MQENDSCGKVIYMGDIQGPEKVNNTCVKTVHAGMMDIGFTVPVLQSLASHLWIQCGGEIFKMSVCSMW
jgi:hypothetical protein